MTESRHILALLSLIGLATASAAIPADRTSPSPLADSWVRAQAIDLARYYPSRDAASNALAALEREASSFAKAKPAEDIDVFLRQADGLIGRARRLDVYFTILAARDIDDQPAATAAQRVDAVKSEIGRTVDAVLRARQARNRVGGAAGSRRYGYLLSRAIEDSRHDLSPEGASVLDATAGAASSAYWTIYQKVQRLPVAEARKTAAPAPSGDDRSRREAEWRARWLAADVRADADAAILVAIVNQGTAVAKLEKYPDAAAMGYAQRGLSQAMVNQMLAAVQSNLGLYQAYHRARAARMKALADIADPRPWDVGLLQRGSTARFTFDDARRIVPAALAPLGQDYAQHFVDLLKLDAGRVDVAAQAGNRESGGFSVNAPGVPSGLYMASFDGSINDLRVVAHEGGHAVAAQFANEGGTASFFVHGPNWLMESYAIFNELLLFDYLARTSATRNDRAYYHGLLVDDMMFQVFGSAEEATLEQSICDGIAAGKIRSAADLNEATFRVTRAFEPWPDDILRASSSLWSTKRLFFQDPFYLVNYLYAGIVAINLYKQAKRHPDSFPTRYAALLRRGYDAPPMTLLAP